MRWNPLKGKIHWRLPEPAFVAPLRARWQSLPPRDQQVLKWGGVVAGALLFLGAFWLPMQRDLGRLRLSVPQDQAKLLTMQAQAQQVMQLKARGAGAARGGNILATIEQTASARGLKAAITRMEPEGATGARLTLENAHFNTLMGWLNDIQNQQGVRVEAAQLDSQSAAGMVNARLTLRGPAS